MAKLTVYFKERIINAKQFDSGVVHIGRDETNTLAVDSLAIAPAHAAVIIREDSYLIKELNENFPLIINGEHLKESTLADGDKITVGKHSIVFNTTEAYIRDTEQTNLEDEDLQTLRQELDGSLNMPDANLQVMDGKHIGRMIPLKKAMTRLGHSGGGIAVIARRKEGYFISALENHNSLKVNETILDDNTIKLHNSDTVLIDDTAMQFFMTNS